MKRFVSLLGPTLWSALLLAVAFHAAVAATEETVGAIHGIHGPPTITTLEDGSAIAVAYVVRPGKDADLFAWRIGKTSTDSKWPKEGLAVCTVRGDQLDPVAVSDGAGGAIIAWEDLRRGSDLDLYAQHVLASGSIDPAWPEGGVPVCASQGTQSRVRMVSDEAGGAWLAWEDRRSGEYDVYLGWVGARGTTGPALPAGGRAAARGPLFRQAPALAKDGSGGVLVAWEEQRPGSGSVVHIGHFLENGVRDTRWPEAGLAICSAPGDQMEPALIGDGSGGALVVWSHDPDDATARLRIQHVLESGAVDERWPSDGRPLCRADALQRQAALVSDGMGGAFIAWQDSRSETAEHVLVQHFENSGAVDPTWPEQGLEVSSAKGPLVSPTLALARDALFVSWLDRQAPGEVRGYAQRIAVDGRIDPTWPKAGAWLSRTASEDLCLSPGPEGATALWRAGTTQTIQAVRLTATPPLLGGDRATSPGSAAVVTMLFAPRPNPARSPVTFRFSLERRLAARLSIYDLQGRRIAALLDRTLDSGVHEATWERSDAHGHPVGAGIYFARFEAEDQRFTRRFVVVR